MLKISDVVNRLRELQEERGDVEIFEALRDYGWCEFTPESLTKFIRIATGQERGGPVVEYLVIGKH
jgi:hypothetical protein